jgi:hypothetical protein
MDKSKEILLGRLCRKLKLLRVRRNWEMRTILKLTEGKWVLEMLAELVYFHGIIHVIS